MFAIDLMLPFHCFTDEMTEGTSVGDEPTYLLVLRLWTTELALFKDLGTFCFTKHNVHRFTLNLHPSKIMIVESLP